MNRSSNRLLVVLAMLLLASFVVGSPLLGFQDPAPPPPPPATWTMNDPDDGEPIMDSSSVDGAGGAPDAGLGYTLKVECIGGLTRSATGTTDVDWLWHTSVNPPAGGWPTPEIIPNGNVSVYVGGVAQVNHTVVFYPEP